MSFDARQIFFPRISFAVCKKNSNFALCKSNIKMKKFLLLLLLAVSFVFTACQKSDVCHIDGTVPNAKYNGKYIFLIAENSSIREKVGVDSAKIVNGKFTIDTKKNMLCILRLDWRYRYGLQDLLVVVEPGDVKCTIDSVSSAVGTPNNDQLQKWKEMTEIHMKQYGQLISMYQKAHFSGDTALAAKIKVHADSIHGSYKYKTHKIADACSDGPLKEYLYKLYPDK